jgi:hypothetical protein
MLNPRHEMQRAVNCLTPVLKWFCKHWDVAENADPEEPGPGSRAGGQPNSSSGAPDPLAGHGVHAMVSLRPDWNIGPAVCWELQPSIASANPHLAGPRPGQGSM